MEKVVLFKTKLQANIHYLFHNVPIALLDDGNVLVLWGNTKQAEIYDYKKNKFVLTKGKMNYISYLVSADGAITKYKPLNILRFNYQTIKLNNGNIFIIGGYNTTNGKQDYPIIKSEIYYK